MDWDTLHHALPGVQIPDTVRCFEPPGVDVEFETNALVEVELPKIAFLTVVCTPASAAQREERKLRWNSTS